MVREGFIISLLRNPKERETVVKRDLTKITKLSAKGQLQPLSEALGSFYFLHLSDPRALAGRIPFQL